MRRVLAAVLVVGSVVAAGWWVLGSRQAAGVPELVLDHTRPRPQGDYYVQLVPEPTDLNPFTTRDAVARRSILSYTHDALLKIDPDLGVPVPALADRIEPQPDGLTYRLRLRPGVRFSDGAPVDLEDVRFTWQLARAAKDLPGSMWSDLQFLKRFEIDGDEVVLTMRERHFAALGLVGASFVVVQRAHFEREVARLAAERGEDPPEDPSDPRFVEAVMQLTLPGPGTGPYQLATDAATGQLMWRPGTDLWLVQNPYSWRRDAHPDYFNLAGLRFLFTGGGLETRTLLRTQEVDWVVDDDAAELLAGDATLAEHYRLMEYGYLNLGPVFIVWNHRVPALADRRVRSALSRCFDLDQIVAPLAGRGTPAATWFLPSSPRSEGATPIAQDLDRARELLAEAGYGPDRPLEVSVLTIAHPEFEQIVDLAQPGFARAGVTLRKEIVDPASLTQRLRDGEFEGGVYAWNPDVFNDPTEVFHSTEAVHNWMGFESAAIDDLLERARVEMDPSRRDASYREFHRVFAEEQPLTLLYHRRIVGLLHRRFQGVSVGAMGLSPRRWWVAPDAILHR